MKEIIVKVAPWVLLALLSLAFWNQCNEPKEILIKTDTVRVTHVDTAFIDREVPVVVTKYIEKPKPKSTNVIGQDTTRFYSDTSFIEKDFYLFYNADVQGLLNNIQLGYFDNRPEKVVTITEKETVTNDIIRDPSGLYIGAQIGTGREVIPSIMFMRKRISITAGYNVYNKSVVIGGYYRILQPP